MSKIPPRDWPKYGSVKECSRCGEADVDNSARSCPERAFMMDWPSEFNPMIRVCGSCGHHWLEHPLDFDFDKWFDIWRLEETIERLQKELTEARKAVE